MIRLEGHTGLRLQRGSVFINLKTGFLDRDEKLYYEIENRIGTIEKQMSRLKLMLRTSKTHGGKRYRARKRTQQDRISAYAEKLFLLKSASSFHKEHVGSGVGFEFKTGTNKFMWSESLNLKSSSSSDSNSHYEVLATEYFNSRGYYSGQEVPINPPMEWMFGDPNWLGSITSSDSESSILSELSSDVEGGNSKYYGGSALSFLSNDDLW